MSIKFKAKLEPRTEDGGFGPSECTKCGTKTTCYLELHLHTTYILLCRGCLEEGIEVICDEMVKSYTNSFDGVVRSS